MDYICFQKYLEVKSSLNNKRIVLIFYKLQRLPPQQKPMLSEDFLKNLYLNPGINIRFPHLQLLNFEISEINSNQIILRLSDGKSFIDSPLSGPYKILNSEIISEEQYQPNKTIGKLNIVTIDYFSKLNKDKICQLQLIIRKIDPISNVDSIIGMPLEISQYMENNSIERNNVYPFLTGNFNQQHGGFKIQSSENINQSNLFISQQKFQNHNESSLISSKKRTKPKGQNQITMPGFDNFLDLHQIQSNKQGLFIGRLVRVKTGTRQLKQGSGTITVLYLGLVDMHNNLVRISLVGKNAIRQQEHLMKYQVYTIKGIQTTSLDRSRFIYYLKLKDKEYNIKRVTQQPYVSVLPKYWFHFEHQPTQIVNLDDNQIEVVDVIGIVDQIDDKITYRNVHSFQQARNVVRVTVRNRIKSVKISFWAEQIKMLEITQLKKYDEVIMLDLKKKKNIFLDYTIESNLIKLKDQPQLRQIYAHLLPQIQTMQEPQNIKQLIEYFEAQNNRSKVKHLRYFLFNESVYMMKIYENKVFFKICQDCKKKIDRDDTKCPDCGCTHSLYKFNCLIDFADYSGSIKCVSFDPTTQKILGISANQVQSKTQQSMKEYFEKFFYNFYEIGIEYKNDRFVLRTIEPIQNTSQQIHKNLDKIELIKKDKDFIHLL